MAQTETDPDAQVIEQLRKHGSNIAKPHPMEFYLYFPSEPQAQAAAATLREAHFRIIRLELGAHGNAWLVLSQKTMIPTPENVRASSLQLANIAAAHSGEYDGWDSPIVK